MDGDRMSLRLCPHTDLPVPYCGCGRHKKPKAKPEPLPTITGGVVQKQRAASRSKNQIQLFHTSTHDDDLRLVERFLPPQFFDLYARLLEAEFSGAALGSFSAKADPEMKVSKSKSPAEMAIIRRERALWARWRLDRKIKKLTTEMHNALVELDDSSANTSKPIRRRCSGKCKKFGDPDWLYCPNCGGPMVEY